MHAVSRVFRLAHKELREILRDRRTIVTLVAMPLMLYPLMSVAFQQFYLAARVTGQTGGYNFGNLSSAESKVFEDRFGRAQHLWYQSRLKPGEKPPRGGRIQTEPQIAWYASDPGTSAAERAESLERLKAALKEGAIDLIIDIPSVYGPKSHLAQAVVGQLEGILTDISPLDQPPKKDWLLPCKIYLMPSSPSGRAALAHVETVLAFSNEADLKTRLNLPDAKPRINLLTIERVFLEGPGADKMVSLAALVPLILILMTITGAVYPAIDLTAGERERGTLEILVAAPVPRFQLLMAKYLSVWTVAVLTALVNLVCMTITLSWSGMGSMLLGAEGMTPLIFIDVLGLLLLFAAFFSAALLCLTSFARSFKEAQAYLIPLMLASLTPGILAMLPGLELNRFLAALPLVNIVLMARDQFEGGVDPVNGTIVIVTTLMYALAALSLAARVFGAESVLYSEQSSWADLLRRPREAQPTATLPALLWCLALMVPIHFGLDALVRALEPTVVQGIELLLGVNVVLFLVLPMLFVYLGRVDLQVGFGMHWPRPAALLAGLILGASLWPIALWLVALTGTSRILEERFGGLVESMKQAREAVGMGVFAIVIVPAILEEFFFRGLLFNALKRRCGPLVTIGASGVLFGVTHLVLGGALGVERLLPSTLLGLILGYVCWCSGSLWPSMILHVSHNTALLLVDASATAAIPWQWLAGGAAGAVLGMSILVIWGRRTANPHPS